MVEKRGYGQAMKPTDLPLLPNALCRGERPELFISDDSDEQYGRWRFDPKPGIAVCWRCPERKPCLEYALDNPTLVGVWGATMPADRAAMRADRDGG